MMNRTRIHCRQRRARIVPRTNNNIPRQTLYVDHGNLDFSTKPTSSFFATGDIPTNLRQKTWYHHLLRGAGKKQRNDAKKKVLAAHETRPAPLIK